MEPAGAGVSIITVGVSITGSERPPAFAETAETAKTAAAAIVVVRRMSVLQINARLNDLDFFIHLAIGKQAGF
jgi:hypothetical protein